MWIHPVDEHEAEGDVAALYAGVTRSWGGVDNIVKAHGHHPEALRALLTFYHGVMHGKGPLGLTRREMIAVTVSALSDCGY
jgi:alkylhydroperoxidase family enzyme